MSTYMYLTCTEYDMSKLNSILFKQHCITVNDGQEEPEHELSPQSFRAFNKHKTGEPYFNSRAFGSGLLPLTWTDMATQTIYPVYESTISQDDSGWVSSGSTLTRGMSRCTKDRSAYIVVSYDGSGYALERGAITELSKRNFSPESGWKLEPRCGPGWYTAGAYFRMTGNINRPVISVRTPGSILDAENFLEKMVSEAIQGFDHFESFYPQYPISGKLRLMRDIYATYDIGGSAPYDPNFAGFARNLRYNDLKLRYRTGLCQAYLNAVQGIPTLSGMNNLENALQLLGLAKDIIVSKGRPSKLGKLPEELRNLWLATRYQFNTSLSDVIEIERLTSRAVDLIGSAYLKSDGYYYADGCKYHVVTTWSPQGIKSLQSPIERLGLAPTPSNLWDLLPYSFVVDWFLQIGSLLEFEEQRILALRAQPTECWMSIEKDGENVFGNRQIEYIRLPGIPSASDIAFLPEYTWYDPSGRVIAKRAADAAALFLPKR